jgi:hypothetical protein
MGFLARVFRPDQPSVGKSWFVRSAGTVVTPDTAMEVSAYYRGVIYIATQIAKLPIDIKTDTNKIVLNKKQNSTFDIPIKINSGIISTKQIEKGDKFTVYYNYNIDRTAPPFLPENYTNY